MDYNNIDVLISGLNNWWQKIVEYSNFCIKSQLFIRLNKLSDSISNKPINTLPINKLPTEFCVISWLSYYVLCKY